jgi:hypothetical protein
MTAVAENVSPERKRGAVTVPTPVAVSAPTATGAPLARLPAAWSLENLLSHAMGRGAVPRSSARAAGGVRSGPEVQASLQGGEMPARKSTTKQVCDGTGSRWAVADGTPICPDCELSPGAIGAEMPAKRGKGFTGSVPEHYISNVTAAEVEQAKARQAKPDPVRRPPKPVTVERYTIIAGDHGKFYVHDAEVGDVVGLMNGYGSQERAERKVRDLLAEDGTESADKVPAAGTRASKAEAAAQAKRTVPERAVRQATPVKATPVKATPAKAAAKPKATAKSKPAKAATEEANGSDGKAWKQLAKRSLATLALEAVAEMFQNIPDGDPIFEAMEEDEAAMTLSNWMHHWPVGEEWPTEILPIPDRSNWR